MRLAKGRAHQPFPGFLRPINGKLGKFFCHAASKAAPEGAALLMLKNGR